MRDGAASEGGAFPSTQHSAVRGVGSGDPEVRRQSWAAIVEACWKPAYKHLRVKWKASREGAEDALQAFFERAVEGEVLAGYQPERARFRTFFKVCLDRHMANEGRAARREKRGGGATALDFAQAEAELERAGAAAWDSPDQCFDREWRRQLFAAAVAALEQQCAAEGKPQVFEAFARYDLSDPPQPRYQDVADALGVPVTTVTNHLGWARRTLRALVLEQLAQLTATEAELRDEAVEAGVG